MAHDKELRLCAADRRMIAAQVAESVREAVLEGLDELLDVKGTAEFMHRSEGWVRQHRAELGAVYLGEHPYFSRLGLITMVKSRSGLGKGFGNGQDD